VQLLKRIENICLFPNYFSSLLKEPEELSSPLLYLSDAEEFVDPKNQYSIGLDVRKEKPQKAKILSLLVIFLIYPELRPS
jgi:hypothetical protein